MKNWFVHGLLNGSYLQYQIFSFIFSLFKKFTNCEPTKSNLIQHDIADLDKIHGPK